MLARVRFLKSKSILKVIRARYNENTAKRIWKLDKFANCLRKAELDLEVLRVAVIIFLFLARVRFP